MWEEESYEEQLQSFRKSVANNTSAPWPSSPIGLAWKNIGYDQFTMGASIPGQGTAMPSFDREPPGWSYPSPALPSARASMPHSEKFRHPPSIYDQSKKQKSINHVMLSLVPAAVSGTARTVMLSCLWW